MTCPANGAPPAPSHQGDPRQAVPMISGHVSIKVTDGRRVARGNGPLSLIAHKSCVTLTRYPAAVTLLPLAGPMITMSVDWPEIQFT